MNLTLLNSLISGLFTGVFISYLNSLFTKRRSQLQTTFELHREWNDESLRFGLSGMEFRGVCKVSELI